LPQGQQIFVLNPEVNIYKYSDCCHKIFEKPLYQGHKYKTFCFEIIAELRSKLQLPASKWKAIVLHAIHLM